MIAIREQIIAALASRFGAQRANSVIDALPAFSLWDSSDTSAEQDSYGQMSVVTTLTLESVHQANADPSQWSAQGNARLAELIAIGTGGDRTLGGLCDELRYAGGTIYYPDEGSDVIGVDLNIEVRWRFDLGDPYTNSMQ